MTKQRQVLLGIKALIETALPLAKVTGFDVDATKPTRRDPGGNVIGHPGEPGEPEVDLSPPTFNYSHELFLEVAGPEGDDGSTRDAMIGAIGDAIAADRTLGDLCDWLEARAPDRNDRSGDMIVTSPWALVPIVADYSTPDPLA